MAAKFLQNLPCY